MAARTFDHTKYQRRRVRSQIAMALCMGATLIGLSCLAAVLGTLLYKGVSGLSLKIFTEMTPPPGNDGGLLNAIAGSLIMTTLAVLIGTPVGILAGTYMAEYGRHARLTSVIRFLNDILLSAPSIVIGLFVYTIAVATVGHFSGYAGALALAVIVMPVVIRTTEDMLRLVPDTMREAECLGLIRIQRGGKKGTTMTELSRYCLTYLWTKTRSNGLWQWQEPTDDWKRFEDDAIGPTSGTVKAPLREPVSAPLREPPHCQVHEFVQSHVAPLREPPSIFRAGASFQDGRGGGAMRRKPTRATE